MSPHQPWAHGLDEIRFPAGADGFTREVLAELLENVPLAIAVTLAPTQQFAFANRLFRSALSVSNDNLIGKAAPDVMGSHYTPEIRALREKVITTGEPQEIGAAPFTLTPGQTTYWDIKMLPVRETGDRIKGALILAANVTERVKAHDEAERQAKAASLHNERLALAIEATELGLWEWNVETGETFWSDQLRQILGLTEGQDASYEAWVAAIHPEDRERTLASVTALLDPGSGGQLQIEHRIVQPDGEVRWISCRGRMLYEISDGALKPARLLGTVLDITDRQRNEEARQLLVQELNHRVKNLFAVAGGMVALTGRTADTPRQMADALRGRLDALARANELIRPVIAVGEPLQQTTSVDEIVRAVLAPHLHDGFPHQMSVEGAPISIGAKAAASLSLVLHELATNAAKYGALSVHDGQLRIRWMQDGAGFTLSWQEENGPRIDGPPETEGFGSQLTRRSITGQLGGTIAYDWRPEGLRIRIELPLDQLSL